MNCASSWLPIRSYIEMHGQQNISYIEMHGQQNVRPNPVLAFLKFLTKFVLPAKCVILSTLLAFDCEHHLGIIFRICFLSVSSYT